MNSTVISPAGNTIEVYSDKDWATLSGVPVRTLMWTASRSGLLQALWHGGTIEDRPSGRASRKLIDLAHQYGYQPDTATALLAMLNSPSLSLAIKREMNGKRTYLIELVALPECWLKHLQTAAVEPVVEPVPENWNAPEPAIEPHVPLSEGPWGDEAADSHLSVVVDEPLPEPPMELQVTEAVAHALLTQVIEIITAGPTIIADTQHVVELENDLHQAQLRLSQRLEENEKLRRVLRQSNDELAAIKHERDGLRQRLKAAEYNLEKAMSGDAQRIIQGEVMKELDKVMRAAPGSTKGAA